MSIVGDRLRTRREAAGLTLEDLAGQIGMNFQQYWRYEKGENAPSFETLRKIAEVLNVSLDYLAGLVDDPSGVLAESDLSGMERRLVTAARNGESAEALEALAAILKGNDKPAIAGN